MTAFLTSGIIAATDGIIGGEYVDGGGIGYLPLCIQPILVMKSNRAKLKTILQRANRRNMPASIYIEDMFSTGFDEANRETVLKYPSGEQPLVDSSLEILMRHRAVLFGLLGAFFVYAAFYPSVQPIAFVAAFVSIASFFWLALSIGDYNEAIRRVIIADVVAALSLVAAILLYYVKS